VTDVIASRPPRYSVEANARASLVITEKVAPLHSVDSDIENSDLGDDGHFLGNDADHPAPTEEEEKELLRVAGSIPPIAYVLCVVEFAERASYYGATQVFNNFLQKSLPKGM
jgi:POT family proton-dependent oligopeptide transporter